VPSTIQEKRQALCLSVVITIALSSPCIKDVEVLIHPTALVTAPAMHQCLIIMCCRHRVYHHASPSTLPNDYLVQDVDVLITPTTPVTAPAIPPGATTKGLSDVSQVHQLMCAITTAGLPECSVQAQPTPRSSAVHPSYRFNTLHQYNASLHGCNCLRSGSHPT